MNIKNIGIIAGILFLVTSTVFAGSFFGGKKHQLSLQDIFNQSPRFTENKGQLKQYNIDWLQCGNIEFYTQSFGGTAYFAENGIGFGFIKESLDEKKHPSKQELEEENEEEEHKSKSSTGFFLEFAGKNKNSKLIGLGKQITKFNYYKGNSHITDISNYDQLLYQELYNNIDLKYYLHEGKLKFDYILKAEADVHQIQLRYNGMKKVSVNKKGELEILTDWGVLIDAKPFSYQLIDSEKKEINVCYTKLENGNIGFEIKGTYDPHKELVIDPPTLTWATLVGSTNGDGYLYDITMDKDGNVYGTGWYNQGFPLVNPVDVVNEAGDPFIFKLAADGKTLLFSTWFGGMAGVGNNENGTGIAVNTAGEIFVCGFTDNATDFPKAGTPIQSTLGGGKDIFAGKFSAAGALVYSTFYGGSGDDLAFGIDIDASNNAFITGCTTSSTGFASGGAFQSTLGGAMDAFILKINPTGSAALFCTYFGGSGNDLGRDIVVDSEGNPYIGGGTASSAGIASAGSFDNTFGGDAVDGFVAKFNGANGARIYGAYCGGNNEDKVEAVDVKCNGELVVAGYTRSYNNTFISVNAIQANNGAAFGGPRDGFMRRISPDGSTLLNSTFMGGTDEDAVKNGVPFDLTVQQRGSSVSVNRKGNIAFSMCTLDNTLPMVSPVQATNGGGLAGLGDAYVFVTDSTGKKIIFSTYFGGDGDDYPTAGIHYHPINDNVFALAGCSHSSDGTFPTTAGSFLTVRETALTSDQPYVALYSYIPCKIKVTLPLPAAVCKGDTLTFTADTLCGDATPTFKWTVNGVVQAGQVSKTFVTNKLNNNDKVCVIFSKIIPSCFPVTEADTACVTALINPSPTVTLKDDSICSGDTAVIDPGGTYDSYLWSSAETTPTISKSVAGMYWVEVTKNGCKARDTMNLFVRTPLTIIDSARTCNGANTGYKVTLKILGGDSASYSVTGLAGTLTGRIFTSNLVPSGTSFSLSVSDKFNCNNVVYSGNLICNNCSPLVTIGSDKFICKGDSAPIQFHLSGAVAPYIVVYSDGSTNDTLSGISDGFIKFVAPSDTTVYTTISVTDKNGCSAASSSSVKITPVPVFLLPTTPADASCFQACDGSVKVTPQNGIGAFTYFWSPMPAQGQGTDSASKLCAGTYQVLVTDFYGCKDSVSTTISQPQKIVYSLDSINANCNQSNGSAEIIIASGGTSPYSYQWDNGAASQTTATAIHLKPGVYSVTVSDKKNCSVTDSVEVLNISGPTFSSVFSNPLCTSDCNGSAVLTNISGGTRPFTYVWTIPLNASPLIQDSSASALCAGKYKVVLTDKFNCKDSAAFTIVDPAPVQIAVNPSVRTCVKGSMQISAVANGGTAGYTYTWSANPTLSSTTISNPVATPVVASTYYVSARDTNNCPSGIDSVILSPDPVADFIFDSILNCHSVLVNFTNQSTASTSGHTCAWDFGNGSTSNICDPDFTFNSGNYTVILSIKDDNNCVDSTKKNIQLSIYDSPFPVFTASPQPTTLLNPIITFTNTTNGSYSYLWHFGTGDSSKQINPVYTYPDTGIYKACLRASNALDCYKDTCINIEIKGITSFYIPNAFSPNGDGKNEYFIPVSTGIDPGHYELLIFDRWGELIFTSNNLGIGWDGTYKGKPVQIDVYVWKVNARETDSQKIINRIGRVSVIR